MFVAMLVSTGEVALCHASKYACLCYYSTYCSVVIDTDILFVYFIYCKMGVHPVAVVGRLVQK
jgi:hypothetical protein